MVLVRFGSYYQRGHNNGMHSSQIKTGGPILRGKNNLFNLNKNDYKMLNPEKLNLL